MLGTNFCITDLSDVSLLRTNNIRTKEHKIQYAEPFCPSALLSEIIIRFGLTVVQEKQEQVSKRNIFCPAGIDNVQFLTGYTYNFINLSDFDDLVTVIWADEPFDSSKQYTFSDIV